jgi:hypothetical protein
MADIQLDLSQDEPRHPNSAVSGTSLLRLGSQYPSRRSGATDAHWIATIFRRRQHLGAASASANGQMDVWNPTRPGSAVLQNGGLVGDSRGLRGAHWPHLRGNSDVSA